jgi:hypothetical protein
VAEIVRLHGAAYLARFADRILPSHRRALRSSVRSLRLNIRASY